VSLVPRKAKKRKVSITQRVKGLQFDLNEKASSISLWNRRRKDAKTAETKKKYADKIKQEKAELIRIEKERKVISARLRNQNLKKKLGKEKEDALINKLTSVQRKVEGVKRVAGAVTGKKKRKKNKNPRKKKQSNKGPAGKKIYTGKRGGKYYKKNGRRVYI